MFFGAFQSRSQDVWLLTLALSVLACAQAPGAVDSGDAAADVTSDMAVPALTTVWAVGVTDADWTDASRQTPANGDTAAHPGRHLPVQVWYPASGAAGGDDRAIAER